MTEVGQSESNWGRRGRHSMYRGAVVVEVFRVASCAENRTSVARLSSSTCWAEMLKDGRPF